MSAEPPFFHFENGPSFPDARVEELGDAINRLHALVYETITLPGFKDGDDKVQVVTVRVSKSLHDKLKKEAHRQCLSLNQLCIAKLTGETVASLLRK